MNAAVAFKSTAVIGDGATAAPDGTDDFGEVPHALTSRLSAIVKKNIFFIPISFI
jgi:hypothetical protein